VKRSLGWRVALTLAVLIGSIAAYWWRGHEALKRSPTAPPDPTVSDVLKNGLKLGLDLRGGIHLVMQVKTGDALRVEAQDAAEHLKDEHSWLALLPEQQQFRFVGDYFRILRASLSAGGYTQLATFLASWRGTAEVYALGLTPAEFDADYAEASGPVTRPVDE